MVLNPKHVGCTDGALRAAGREHWEGSRPPGVHEARPPQGKGPVGEERDCAAPWRRGQHADRRVARAAGCDRPCPAMPSARRSACNAPIGMTAPPPGGSSLTIFWHLALRPGAAAHCEHCYVIHLLRRLWPAARRPCTQHVAVKRREMRGGAPWTGVSCWANRVVRESGQAQAGSAARTLDGEAYTMSDMSGAGQAASSPHLVADDVHGSDGALVPARNLPLCPSSQWAGA